MKTSRRFQTSRQAWPEPIRSGNEVTSTDLSQRLRKTYETTSAHLSQYGAVGILQSMVKWTNAEMLFTTSSPLMIRQTPTCVQRNTNKETFCPTLSLPPIKGCKLPPCLNTKSVECSKLDSKPGKENFFRGSVRGLRKSTRIQQQHKEGLLSRSVHTATGKQASLRCTKSPRPPAVHNKTIALHRPVALRVSESSVPVTSDVRQAADANRQVPCGQSEMSSGTQSPDDSDYENGSEKHGHLQLGVLETLLPKEDYYTNERIEAWIINVNDILFSLSKNLWTVIPPEEEQDTAIKIVYDGD